MKKNVTTNEFHKSLIGEVFNASISEREAFCIMLILHSCNLLLSSEAKVKGGAKGFAPIISRYASEIIASLYSEGEKANHNYWYDKWNGDWKAYAVLECIPEEIKSDLQEILCRLKSHSWVEKLEDEDWDLLATIS